MSKQSELRSLLETIFVVVGSFVGAIIIITLATSKPEPADTSTMVVENEPMEANVQQVTEVKVAEKSDMKKNKPFGYLIGTFDDGMILKGEVFKPFQINYTSSDFVKKILIKKIYKNTDYLTEYTNGNLENGEIFFENGDHYKGEFANYRRGQSQPPRA